MPSAANPMAPSGKSHPQTHPGWPQPYSCSWCRICWNPFHWILAWMWSWLLESRCISVGITLPKDHFVVFSWFCSHLRRFRAEALSFKICSWSCNWYFPARRTWRRKEHSISFVKASATWAPEWTHRKLTFSANMSLMDLANSWVLNSWQFGGAVRLTKSNNDLQSVTAMSSLKVALAIVYGRFCNVCLGCFQLSCGFIIQAQNKRSQESWSNVELSEVASADNVLTTTFWIFLHPHDIGDTGLVTLFLIWSWLVIIIMPVWESGCFFDEKEASEKAKNRILSTRIGWIVMAISLKRFASCRTLLAWTRVCTLALFTWLCRKLSRLDRSGLVFTAAYWSDPIRARRSCCSSLVTGLSISFLRSELTWMGSILDTYCYILLLWESDAVVGILIHLDACEYKALILFGSKWITLF